MKPRVFGWLLLGVLAATFPGLLLGTESMAYRDFGTYAHPLAYYHREAFWRGELPLWNPMLNCGLPFLAQWNTLTLYPPSLIYLLLPFPWSLNLFSLAHLFLGGWGMYRLAGRWCGGSGWGAGLAGLAYALNGVALNSLMWTSTTASLAWMPWVVLTAEAAWREGRSRVLMAGLVGALQMLSGTPEVILLTWLVVGALALTEWIADRRQPVAGGLRLGAVVVIVAGLSAAQWGPFLDLVASSQRGGEFAAEQARMESWWTLPWWGWANLLAPLFRCQATPFGTFVHSVESWVTTYYLGAGTLVLAALGLGLARERRVKFLLGVAVFGWWVALGSKAGLYAALKAVFPAMGLMRYPVKFIVLVVFALPLLAAFGVRWLEEAGERTRPRWRMAWWVAGGTVLVMAAVAVWSRLQTIPGENASMTARSAAFSAGGLGLLLLALSFRGRYERAGIDLAAGAACLLLATDLSLHLPNAVPTLPAKAMASRAVVLDPPPLAGQSRAMPALRAVLEAQKQAAPDVLSQYATYRLGLMFSCPLLDHIPTVGGFFPLYLRETSMLEDRFMQTFPAGMASFLGITHTTAAGKLTDWERRTNSLPWITGGQAVAFAEPVAALEAVLKPDFDPRHRVYLPLEARGSVAVTNAARVAIGVKRFGAHRVELSASAEAASVVVIAQSWHRHWRAFVDGQPVPLWRANFAFQALAVPSGEHQVTLRYRDTRFEAGLWLGGLTLLAMGAAGWCWRRTGSAASATDPRRTTPEEKA